MNISKELYGLNANDVLRCKQRVGSVREHFDADLVVCFVRGEDGWSVAALEGPLVDQYWSEKLPLQSLRLTCEERQGRYGVEVLESLAVPTRTMMTTHAVSSISAMADEGRTVLIAARRLQRSLYQKQDLDRLERFLAAFEQAEAQSPRVNL